MFRLIYQNMISNKSSHVAGIVAQRSSLKTSLGLGESQLETATTSVEPLLGNHAFNANISLQR